ncbi:MAG TPA: Uma2 family endonuclease [Gemmatimonadaceae bacterium]|nr:Uma2 family endonuclease [Gemmatimonadaceae bacterium]
MVLPLPRYTLRDLEQFPEDGNRYELVDGVLLVTPAPALTHQVVANRLQLQLSRVLVSAGHAHVAGPGAVTVEPATQLQPDILVFPARFSPMLKWMDITEHWLAVEVLSRSSRMYDREVKRAAYFALGVRQLWLVDWRDRSVEVWRSPHARRAVRDVIRWRVPTLDLVVPIDLHELFAAIE